jgi:hypothetical protein
MRRLATIVTAVCLAVSFFGAGTASADGPVNTPPTGRFAFACYGKQHPNLRCDRQALANINRAHAAEGLGKMVLPENYASLTVVKQGIVVSNLERTIRGLPALPGKRAWDQLAKAGAVAGHDPSGPDGHAWGSVYIALADPLASDYFWMYWDGPGSLNPDCVQPTDPGCFGHRNIILGDIWTGMGVGNQGASMAQLFVQ